jgi:hypothetical protein
MKVMFDDNDVLCVYSEDTGGWYGSDELWDEETLFYFTEAKNEGLLDEEFELTDYGLEMMEGNDEGEDD